MQDWPPYEKENQKALREERERPRTQFREDNRQEASQALDIFKRGTITGMRIDRLQRPCFPQRDEVCSSIVTTLTFMVIFPFGSRNANHMKSIIVFCDGQRVDPIIDEKLCAPYFIPLAR